jgi:peptidoglycan/xylan/chitin deacetylase (PgdA/CDA1 family)
MKPNVIKTALLCAVIAFPPAGIAQNVDASRQIPGGLKPEQTPQFVCIGFDDNYEVDGMRWAIDLLKGKKNPAGAGNAGTFDAKPVRVSFYCNTNNGNPLSSLSGVFMEAYNAGHEIADHTRTHKTDSTTTKATWTTEIKSCRTDLTGIGIPNDKITGFRTPYLQYNDFTFTVLTELSFVYDCSVESGTDADMDGTNFYWPYTLHNGTPDNKKIAAHPGLWEMPVYVVIVPPELRAQIRKKQAKFDDKTGKWTGLDYNMWAPQADNGLAMTKDEYSAALKYSLDQRLKGNRAPLLFGSHSQFYCQAGFANLTPPNATLTAMQAAMEDFITYALGKPDVRIVPERDILTWVKKPVPLITTSVSSAQNNVRQLPVGVIKAGTQGVWLSISISGNYSVSLFSVCGKQIFKTGKMRYQEGNHVVLWPGAFPAKGVYFVKVSEGNFFIPGKFFIVR